MATRLPGGAGLARIVCTLLLFATSAARASDPPPPPPQPNIDSQLPSGTASTASRCDFLDPSYCMFPFPNDFFTVADSSTDTGRLVNLQQDSLPQSSIVLNHHVDPAEWNRNDGFSPGPMILLHVPGIGASTRRASLANSGG